MEFLESVDWGVAAKTGAKSVLAGPKVDLGLAAETVESLLAAAEAAPALVAEVSELGLHNQAQVLVVDRPGWVQQCVAALSQFVGNQPASGIKQKLAAKQAGVQVGVALGLVASRVLGQFDGYSVEPKLLLIAPNILKITRKLEVDPHEFHQWVCLHEQTHQSQFAVAPWLSGYLIDNAKSVLAGDADALDKVMAAMSVIEGHADVMMDQAGPKVIHSLFDIRSKFNRYRSRGGLTAVFNRLTGMKLKLEQYDKGADFCRKVSWKVGIVGFNKVFESAQNLPTMAELDDPQAWVGRVLGQ